MSDVTQCGTVADLLSVLDGVDKDKPIVVNQEGVKFTNVYIRIGDSGVVFDA